VGERGEEGVGGLGDGIVALGRLEELTVPTIGSNPLSKIIICMTSIDFYIFHHQLAFFKFPTYSTL
jgi:hypothetical protein